MAGFSKWVKWELKTIISLKLTKKLIVIFPPGNQDKRVDRFNCLCECFDQQRSNYLRTTIDIEKVIALCFISDEIYSINCLNKDEVNYEIALQIVIFHILKNIGNKY